MKRGLWIIPALIIAGCSSDSSKATDILNSVKDANIQEIIKVALPEEIKSNPAMEYIQNAMDKNQNEIIKNIEILSQDISENNAYITIKIRSANAHIDGDKIKLKRDNKGEWIIIK